eukprot:487850-Pelagomonas_calceolata.AAC.4
MDMSMCAVHKQPSTNFQLQGVGEEAIARLFRRYPGMEYCDLKKDRETGKSKVHFWDVYCDKSGTLNLTRPVCKKN